jgi:hypothetical protein
MSAVTGLAFAPTLPVWILVMLGAAGLLALVPAFRAATPGRFWRLLALALLVAWLAGPRLVRQQWRPRPDIALLMLDRSGSMSIRDRTAQVDAARDKILAEAAAVPGLELRVATVPEQGQQGTRLMMATEAALADIPPDQQAGVIALSDGQIADLPSPAAKPPFTAPSSRRKVRRPIAACGLSMLHATASSAAP